MREKLIQYLKTHTSLVRKVWKLSRVVMQVLGWFIPVHPKTMIFCSFGGRKFDDSPKAIYEEICLREEFDDWRLIWAFVDPEKYEIPRGGKIKIDTFSFFKALLLSKVWISNSGMDRGINFYRRSTIHVETWHGTPLKKIGEDQNQNSLVGSGDKIKKILDKDTIRCAQSEYDRNIFQHVQHATKDSYLLCDLPRNDQLTRFNEEDVKKAKSILGIKDGRKVILYMPTYREYLVNEDYKTYIAPPIDINKWEKELGGEYVLLIRAHYAINAALNIVDNDFVKDVSDYPYINDLYMVADILISDYSSAYFDYAILNRPMFCFAYDMEEYQEKRGLYMDLEKSLPCPIDYNEDSLIEHIKTFDYTDACEATKVFHKKYAPFAGNASKAVVDKILERL